MDVFVHVCDLTMLHLLSIVKYRIVVGVHENLI